MRRVIVPHIQALFLNKCMRKSHVYEGMCVQRLIHKIWTFADNENLWLQQKKKIAHKRFHYCEISHKCSEHSLWHAQQISLLSLHLIHILCLFCLICLFRCLWIGFLLIRVPGNSIFNTEHFATQWQIAVSHTNKYSSNRSSNWTKNKLFIVKFSTCILKNINVI